MKYYWKFGTITYRWTIEEVYFIAYTKVAYLSQIKSKMSENIQIDWIKANHQAIIIAAKCQNAVCKTNNKTLISEDAPQVCT